jgi:hypothetical protein
MRWGLVPAKRCSISSAPCVVLIAWVASSAVCNPSCQPESCNTAFLQPMSSCSQLISAVCKTAGKGLVQLQRLSSNPCLRRAESSQWFLGMIMIRTTLKRKEAWRLPPTAFLFREVTDGSSKRWVVARSRGLAGLLGPGRCVSGGARAMVFAASSRSPGANGRRANVGG